MTDLDAPLGRVIAIDLTQPGRKNWREIVPEVSDSLQGVRLVEERFFAAYLHDAYSHVLLLDLDGKRKGEIALPDLGSITGFGGPLDRELAHGTREDLEVFYGLFRDLDGWIRSRLRSTQLKKWKNPRKFQRIMIKSGFAPQEAHRVWIKMNRWQSVMRRPVRFVMDLNWFRERGLVFLHDFTTAFSRT